MKRMWKIPHFQYTRRCSWSYSPPAATLPPHCPRESPPCPADTPTSSTGSSYERREPPTLSSSLVTGLRPLCRQRGALHQHPPQLQLGPPGQPRQQRAAGQHGLVMCRLWKHNLYCYHHKHLIIFLVLCLCNFIIKLFSR